MQLDRSSIEHTDFSTVRRGYDPAEVRQRLGEIADAVEALRTDASSRQLSNAAEEVVRRIAEVTAEQLRAILDLAERSAADLRQQAEADATRITEEARQRAEETDEWVELQTARFRRAVAATEALADRMGAGASAIGADLEAITWLLDARPQRPALDSPAPAGHEPRSLPALAETAGREAAANTAGDRSGRAEPASGGDEEPGDRAEPATGESQRAGSAASAEEEPESAPGEDETRGSVARRDDEESGSQVMRSVSRADAGDSVAGRGRDTGWRQTGAASGGNHGQSSPEASPHYRSWKMRTAAFEMAAGGADHGEVARHLYTEFRLNDDDVALVDSIVEEAFQNIKDLRPDDRPRGLRRLLGE